MDDHARKRVRLIARVSGLLATVLLGAFAADAFDEGFRGVIVHLVPALVVLAVVIIAWRWEWFGGIVFLVLALIYALVARAHLSWILTISSPLAVIGVLFLSGGNTRNDPDIRMRGS